MKENTVEFEPPTDMRDLWQRQEKELPNVSLQLIRLNARKLDSGARRKVALFYAVAFILAAGFTSALRPHEVVRDVGLGLLVAWAVYVPLLAHKRIWPRELPAEAGMRTCLEFYMGELERQRDFARNIWNRIILPVIPGIGLFMGPPVIKAIRLEAPWANVLPFGGVLVIWLVAFVLQRRRTLGEYQREMDLLSTIQEEA
jgi:hypothetical protein